MKRLARFFITLLMMVFVSIGCETSSDLLTGSQESSPDLSSPETSASYAESVTSLTDESLISDEASPEWGDRLDSMWKHPSWINPWVDSMWVFPSFGDQWRVRADSMWIFPSFGDQWRARADSMWVFPSFGDQWRARVDSMWIFPGSEDQ